MRLLRSPIVALCSIAIILVVSTCRDDQGPSSPRAVTRPAGASVAASTGPVTLVGAGNIALCGQPGAGMTASLLDTLPGTVFADGDNAYNNGTATQYTTCYGPTWGRHLARTLPAPGDLDYKTANASGYFGYFGAAAGDPKQGYYSYDLGSWHVVVLNSGSPQLVPTTATSAQVQWLRADLAAHPAHCTLAYWHHPLFDSKDPPNTNIRPLWDALYAAGVDVVVNAHYGFYERFAPQSPTGAADPTGGIREFVVGTGGAHVDGFGGVRANSQVRNSGTFGVLQLTLDDASYSWQFVPVAGKTFTDSGSGACHGARPTVNAGPDLTTNPGDTVNLSVTVTDPDPSDAPFGYAINWGDGTSSTGSTATQTTPIAAAHAYATVASFRLSVTVTNNSGISGVDTVAVTVVAPPVLIGAGDIADCTRNEDSLTANLMDTIPGTVFADGDNAYPDGSSTVYKNCYNPTWGRFKARTKPVPGNHDYLTAGAAGYFNYFGAIAGQSGKGYYSYDLGTWHIVALNSNIAMNVGSPEEVWLKADLAKSTKRCTLAYWHHPLFSSGNEGAHPEVAPLFQDLYDAGAEVVVVGHDHDYERFAPQSPNGILDTLHGIRQFVAGTGGGGLFSAHPPVANSEVLNDNTNGVLKLTLHTNGYAWKFMPIPGKTFADSGSGSCHDAISGMNQVPTAVPGGPYSGTEGAAVTFNGSGSSDLDGDALGYAWTFGDGSTGTGVAPSHTYVGSGTYTVTLTVTDTRGASGAPVTTTATIANAPPVVNAGPPQTVNIGSPVTLHATFTDGANDGPWAFGIDWGDGSPHTSGSTSSAGPITSTHVYAAGGVNTLTVTVTDNLGAAGSGTTTITATSLVTTLVGAGNIARCDRTNDEATAALLDNIPGTVFALGDGAFPAGTLADYQNCYGPSWGRHKARTYPVTGNHDYDSSATAAGYFGYFGAVAGNPSQGYYSYDLGAWHIVVLNSNDAFVSTLAGSPQETWLRSDLAATTKRCVLAMWHNPRFYSTTSSSFSPTTSVKPFWDDLYAAGAEIIVNAHMQDYERFAPQTSTGVADPTNGIREFIVGTGGGGLDAPNTLITANSEVQISGVYGVLQLTLGDGSYSWQFIPVSGQTDSGTGSCHGAPGAVNQPPTAAAGGPYSGNEGAAVAFDGSGSTDPQGSTLTYAWIFGDGTTGTGVSPTHTYADNGAYTVSLTVTDALGLSSSPSNTTATIANVAPTVSAPPSLGATAGSPVTLSATFSDPGVNDAPWTYSINWGDGSTATTGTTSSQATAITASHTYAASGTDTVRVTVTDKDAGAGSAKTTVSVAAGASPPTAAAGGPYSGNEGAAVAFNGSGSTDPQGSALTYAWTFGDGATGTGATPNHTYADNGTYTVSLTVTDALGLSSSPSTTTATIANVAPTVSAPPSLGATAGSPVTLSATFSDPGTRDAPWSYTINWGDGTAATTGSVTSQTAISAAHTYAAAGSNTATVTVTDKDGGAGSGQTLVTVSQQVASVTLVGAGNIARCDRTNDEATAALLDNIPGTVFALGDAAFPYGTPTNYQNCYDPSWGRHKARTYPVTGNHDYDSSATAAGYFGYFGAIAGDPTQGYYSYDLGAWHIIVLNSNSSNVSTAVGSPQETWLRSDLAATSKRCVLAMWHAPRFYSTTSSTFFPTTSVKPFWDDLYAAGAEIIVNAHMQDYERFAPQTSTGAADPTNGIREFIVGTGGGGLDAPNTLITANSEVQISGVYGVLKLTLGDGSYSWQFIPVAGQTGTDSGSGSCH